MNGAQVGPSLAHPVGAINDGLIPITAGTGLARPFCWFWPGGHTITQEFGEISKLPLPGQLWVSQSSPAQESGQRRSTHREPCTTPSCTHKPRGICHSHDSVISSPPPQNQPASTQTGPGFAFTCFAALVGPSGLDLGKSPSSSGRAAGFKLESTQWPGIASGGEPTVHSWEVWEGTHPVCHCLVATALSSGP